MTTEAIIVLIITFIAIILFVTEVIAIDVVALIAMCALVFSGVLSPDEAVKGFSNSATITVAFMFVLSAALKKTGMLQMLGPQMSSLFRRNFNLGMFAMMTILGILSAFMNNTPLVAIMIPVLMQVAQTSGIHPSKLLMPLSFSVIFGGTCSLIGTSTNIVVSGIVKQAGLPEMGMFDLTPMGLVFLFAGVTYMMFLGVRLIPTRKSEADLKKKFGMDSYLTEIELLPNSDSVGKKIMQSPLVSEMEMDIIELRRGDEKFTLPAGDMVLLAGDILKVRCSVEKIKTLKDKMKVQVASSVMIGDHNLRGYRTTMVELVITSNSEFEGKTLRDLDFRRHYRAIPLAIKHQREIIHDSLHDTKLKAGDVILAEIKSHYIDELKQMEQQQSTPFLILSQESMIDISRRKFALVAAVLLAVVITASAELLPVSIATVAGVIILVVTRMISITEMYDAIQWRIVILLAGSLSLGEAMHKSKLDISLADGLVNNLGGWGPWAILSGVYLVTAILTEIMSNNAAAALMTPIAIAIANSLGVSYEPFVMGVCFAASASFMTPVGYQTNTMIYGLGEYKFLDFIRVGGLLNLLFWILATLLLPIIYPF